MTDDTSTEIVKRTAKLTRADQRALKRELAEATVTRATLARKYGVTGAYITNFAKQYAREIDDIRARLDDEFAGLWIARQEQRIAAYQAEYDIAMESDKYDHHEWIKARTAILSNVARELGQDGEAATTTTHIIVGVNIEADLT